MIPTKWYLTFDQCSVTAANSYISHLLYYGYDNELPYVDSEQNNIDVELTENRLKSKQHRTNHSRKINVENDRPHNSYQLDNKSKLKVNLFRTIPD